MMRRQTGQSVSEYSLAAGLVVVLSITAMSFLGGQVSNVFTSMFSSGSSQVTATGNTNTNSNPGNNSAGNSFPMTITMSNGQQLTVNMPANLKDTVATSGVNGTTSALLADFKSVTEQMHISGDITEEQYSSLIALANQGYRIAEIEGLIEKTANTSANGYTFINTSVQFDGQAMTIWELHTLIGSAPAVPGDYTTPLTTASESNLETANFIKLYNDALSSGALSNPEMQAYVNLLATEIAYLSEVTEAAVATVPGTADPCVYWADIITSETTRLDSDSICQVGGGEVTETTCI
jgi:Flp pilus assembly pilin Flp